MSEYTEKENDGASCQKKLAPPRSLRDAGDRAQIVWDMIAKRYPKAAPLLCEMETVIDRAEGLLHRLRSVPYDNEIGRSNSTEISYSEEFDRQRSTSSVMEFSSNCEEINEEVEEVGTRISYDRIAEMEDPSGSTSSGSIQETEREVSTNLRSHVPSIDESTKQTKILPGYGSQKYESKDRENSTSHDERRDAARTKEVESLEGWGSVVGDEMTNSRRVNVRREISIGRHDRSDSHENSTIHQPRKSDIPRMVEATRIQEGKSTVATTNDRTMCEIDSGTRKKNRKTEASLSPKIRAQTGSDSSPGRNATTTNPESLFPRTKMEKNRNKEKREMIKDNEKHSPKSPTRRKTPAEILMDYASQIGKNVEFKVVSLRDKKNPWKIEASFAGYTDNGIGCSESTVRNDVATKILIMLAGDQMEEKNMKNLTPLSDEQMRDIVALGTEDKPENAMRKLYKFCLDKNAPKPIYSVSNQKYEASGIKHFAVCRALDREGRGSGIHDHTAKMSAAEDLYTKLLSEYCP